MKKKGLIVGCSIVIVAVVVILITVIFENKYKAAISQLNRGDYEGAVETFTALGKYKDSADQAKLAQDEIDYQNALKFLNEENYEDAITAFSNLGEFKDSQDQLKSAEEAKSLLMDNTEQYVYSFAKSHARNGSKVVLDSVSVFCLKAGKIGDTDIEIEESDAGKYIFLKGSLLWENGAKDDLFYLYETNEDGEFYDTDLLSLGKSGSSLQNTYDQYRASVIELVILYYKDLLLLDQELTLEEFIRGEMGYVWIDEESLERINKNLAK